VDGVLTAHCSLFSEREPVALLRRPAQDDMEGLGVWAHLELLWLNLLLSSCNMSNLKVPQGQRGGFPALSGIGPSEQQIEAQSIRL